MEKIKKFLYGMIKNVSKKELILIIVFSLSVVFNMFIFSEFDILISNQSEFGVSVGEVVWLFVWRSLLILLGLFIVLLITCNYCKIAFHIMLALLLGLTLAQYLQILLYNSNYVNRLDGGGAHSASEFMVWLNLIIYVIIILAPTIFIIIKKNELFKKITLILCSLIFVMQFVGLIGVSISAPQKSDNNYLSYSSFEEYSKLSKNGENIVVFLIDALDTRTTQDVFDKWSESKDIFNGFTFFKNNLSQYGQTFPSVLSTLTNIEFTQTQTASEFYLKAWENNILFNALHERNYVVNGLFNGSATYQNLGVLMPYFDNIKKVLLENRFLNNNKIFNSMLQLSLLRSSPFILKNNLAISNYSNLGNELVEIDNIKLKSDYYPKFMSPNTDLTYNSLLKEEGISNIQEKNVFNFVHLNGPHLPYFYNEYLEPSNVNLTLDERSSAQSYGIFNILNEYFNQMKELDIFENSTIFIMADHGDGWRKGGFNNATATLMVKQKGVDDNVPLSINTTAETSNRNFVPTILKLIGADDLTTELSYFELAEPDVHQIRYFYLTTWTGWADGNYYSQTAYNGKKAINGDAWNLDNWSLLEE